MVVPLQYMWRSYTCGRIIKVARDRSPARPTVRLEQATIASGALLLAIREGFERNNALAAAPEEQFTGFRGIIEEKARD